MKKDAVQKLLNPFSELRQVSLLQNGSEKQSSTKNRHSEGTLGLINDCYLVRIMSALLFSTPQHKRKLEPDRKHARKEGKRDNGKKKK